MLLTDTTELVCPRCGGDLVVHDRDRIDDRYLIDGSLRCGQCASRFRVSNGVARFVDDLQGYNPSWNYKWKNLDRGRALNHKILDPTDPAYLIHDIYDRNSHGGRAFASMRGGRAVEIGCGVGQYVLKSLLEHAPAKIIALDLTEGVDTLRRVVAARYPHLLDRIVFVQASVFAMPLRPASFDYVYSLGVLHHTGDTSSAIRAAAGLVKEGGQLNVWVYAAPAYHIDTREKNREHLSRWFPLLRIAHVRAQARAWYALFERLTPAQAERILRPFASPAWYWLSRQPILKLIPRLIMSPPPHPDRDYRLLNLFDGYVNAWAENWTESELFPLMRDCGIVVKGISGWRLGIWGVKDSRFYQDDGDRRY